MKRILLVGAVGCGKTTLLQRLQNRELDYAKTQTLGWEGNVYDTPGEYMQLWYFRNALWAASNDCDMVCLLHPAEVDATRTPPAFNTMFTKPVIGVVTKIDLVDPPDVDRAAGFLDMAGCEQIYRVSSITGEGIEELRAALE